MDDDCVAPPNANGILHCLKFLAQEAASLNLLRTLSAIEDALTMAACESSMQPSRPRLHQSNPVLH